RHLFRIAVVLPADFAVDPLGLVFVFLSRRGLGGARDCATVPRAAVRPLFQFAAQHPDDILVALAIPAARSRFGTAGLLDAAYQGAVFVGKPLEVGAHDSNLDSSEGPGSAFQALPGPRIGFFGRDAEFQTPANSTTIANSPAVTGWMESRMPFRMTSMFSRPGADLIFSRVTRRGNSFSNFTSTITQGFFPGVARRSWYLESGSSAVGSG